MLINFNNDLLLDLDWFINFANIYNGLQLLPPPVRQDWIIECDSTLEGGGAFSPTHFYGISYDTPILKEELNICQLEALNLVLALTMLLPQDPHKFHVIINTDNTASQIVLEEGRSKDVILCACARQTWLLSALKKKKFKKKKKRFTALSCINPAQN